MCMCREVVSFLYFFSEISSGYHSSWWILAFPLISTGMNISPFTSPASRCPISHVGGETAISVAEFSCGNSPFVLVSSAFAILPFRLRNMHRITQIHTTNATATPSPIPTNAPTGNPSLPFSLPPTSVSTESPVPLTREANELVIVCVCVLEEFRVVVTPVWKSVSWYLTSICSAKIVIGPPSMVCM